MSDDTIKARIRKVAELATRGATDGEREAARTHLGAMLAKYGLTLEDVLQEDAPLINVEFTYTEAWEKRLLVQLACCVAGVVRAVYVPKDKRQDRGKVREVWIELTYAERIEVEHLWPQYRKAFEEQLETFYQAFIQSNNLGMPASGEAEPLSEEELAKLLAMMQAVGKTPVTRARHTLQEKNDCP
jgi:hypothetical protein